MAVAVAAGDGRAPHLVAALGDRVAALVTAPGHGQRAYTSPYYARPRPPARSLGHRGAETALAAACAVLAGWEGAYRSRTPLPAETTALYTDPGGWVTEQLQALLDTVDRDTVAELVDLAHDSGSLDTFHRLAGDPPAGSRGTGGIGTGIGTAAPTFVPHWADGDLVLGANPWTDATLLDVKTVLSLRDEARTIRWCHQLLAYAWLDTRDHHRIRRVGLYLARHGALMVWNLDDLAATLGGLDVDDHAGLLRLRREFGDLARRVIAAEGADQRWATIPGD